MCQAIFDDASFYRSLFHLDQAIAADVQAAGCRHCGGRLTAPVAMMAKSTAISMTSPVSMEKSVGQWPVHFVMPRKHAPDTLPIPSNPAVKLREIPATNYAVLRFAGFAGETKVSAKTAGLKA